VLVSAPGCKPDGRDQTSGLVAIAAARIVQPAPAAHRPVLLGIFVFTLQGNPANPAPGCSPVRPYAAAIARWLGGNQLETKPRPGVQGFRRLLPPSQRITTKGVRLVRVIL